MVLQVPKCDDRPLEPYALFDDGLSPLVAGVGGVTRLRISW